MAMSTSTYDIVDSLASADYAADEAMTAFQREKWQDLNMHATRAAALFSRVAAWSKKRVDALEKEAAELHKLMGK